MNQNPHSPVVGVFLAIVFVCTATTPSGTAERQRAGVTYQSSAFVRTTAAKYVSTACGVGSLPSSGFPSLISCQPLEAADRVCNQSQANAAELVTSAARST